MWLARRGLRTRGQGLGWGGEAFFAPFAAFLELLCLKEGLWDALSTSSTSDLWGFHADRTGATVIPECLQHHFHSRLCPQQGESMGSVGDGIYQVEHLRAGRLAPGQGLGVLEARWGVGSLSFHFILELH